MQNLANSIKEVTPKEAKARCQADSRALLLDVREQEEWNARHIPGALHVPLAQIEKEASTQFPDKTTPIICQCRSGKRSLIAAQTLKKLGFTDVTSLAGGIQAWEQAGFPIITGKVLSEDDRLRYARHIALPEIGEAGQQKLLQAKVLIIGAGGLGSAAATYLAAAGVGTLGIVDFDVVELSNLQRQILHTTSRIGTNKVDSAQQALRAINPTICIEPHAVKLTRETIVKLMEPYQIILDGSDNFPTRALVSDACLLLHKPHIYGSVDRLTGEASTFWPEQNGPCYRCLYPALPENACSCTEAGVLGIVPGIIGLLQAMEAIKILIGQGKQLIGRLIRFDALQTTFREFTIAPDPACRSCGAAKPPSASTNDERPCHV